MNPVLSDLLRYLSLSSSQAQDIASSKRKRRFKSCQGYLLWISYELNFRFYSIFRYSSSTTCQSLKNIIDCNICNKLVDYGYCHNINSESLCTVCFKKYMNIKYNVIKLYLLLAKLVIKPEPQLLVPSSPASIQQECILLTSA